MTRFAANLLIALAWAMIGGTLSPVSLATGFAVGYFALWVTRPAGADDAYFRRVPQAIGLALFFLKELVLSSLRVAHDIVTPPIHARPGIVAMPLEARTDLEVALVATLICLTPGTLSLDLSPDRRTLFVHAMFIDSPEQLCAELKRGMERRVLELLR